MFQMMEQDKNLRRRIKQRGDKQSTKLIAQVTDHKDAQQAQEKNG